MKNNSGSRWWRRSRRKDPSTKVAISEKGNNLGSISGTILNEAKYQRFHKDRRKHYVLFHQWKQGKCTDTSRAISRSRIGASKNQNTWPAT